MNHAATKTKPRDVLAWHLSRGNIDEAQFRAGEEFRRHFAGAEAGQSAAGIGTATAGRATAGRATASQRWLVKCYRELGQIGAAIVHDALIHNWTTRQIATARGMAGPQGERYYARRFFECLDALARVYGFLAVPL